MVKVGFRKMSFDIDDDLFFMVDQDSLKKERPRAYILNHIIENYFKLLYIIDKGALEAHPDKIEDEELLWLQSL